MVDLRRTLFDRVFGSGSKPAASRWAGGYTIIEVIIVLAITGVLFSAAFELFAGQSGKTQFSQTMQDLSSVIQKYASQVTAGALPGQSFSCSTASGRPVLNTASQSGEGTNQDCLFLGRAINTTTGSGNVSIYTVLGDRTIHNGASDTGVVATTLDQTSPEPALNTSGNDVWLETYQIEGGATVLSSTVNGSSNQYNLIGLYNNLSQSGSTTNLVGQAYQLGASSVKNCIEGAACSPVSIDHWDLCIQDSDNKTKALLTTNIVAGGITTNLNFGSCS